MHHKIYGRAGWRSEEETLLFDEIEKTKKSGEALKSVFESVARKTGRKPNSVRNYYYARIKAENLQSTALHAGAFVPFSDEEIRALLRTVLSAQANGISVRACTLSMGDGDNKAMLRYQNKYRALIKSKPQLVQEVMEELACEGVHYDPYAQQGKIHVGRPRKEEGLRETAYRAAQKLSRVRGVDAEAVLNSLCVLAQNAAESNTEELKRTCTQLRERVKKQEAELCAQQERFHALLAMYRLKDGERIAEHKA